MPPPDQITINSFRAALYLPGWEEQSVWGWDAQLGTLFAQLWPNGDDSDAPPLTIPSSWTDRSTRWPPTTRPERLAVCIREATGCSVSAAVHAMADQAPPPARDLFVRTLEAAGFQQT
jgi:hypothetical protein